MLQWQYFDITMRRALMFQYTGTHLVREVVYMPQTGTTNYIGQDQLDFPICYMLQTGTTHYIGQDQLDFPICYMLQTGTTNYIGQDQLDFPICYRKASEISSMTSPRVLHTHAPYRMLPQSWSHVIALIRDPRDVLVSYWYFLSGRCQKEIPWEIFLEKFIQGKRKSAIVMKKPHTQTQ